MKRLLALLLLLAACGGDTGPDAPALGPTATSCAAGFCVDHPADWVVEVGETFMTFRHPTIEDASAAFGQVDMIRLVEADGGTWPTSARNTVRAFWNLIAAGDAVLQDLSEEDGRVLSFGKFEDRRMWHVLLPTGGGTAVGVEFRAPNPTWGDHAQLIVGSLREG